MKNYEGYSDPTANLAIGKVERERKRKEMEKALAASNTELYLKNINKELRDLNVTMGEIYKVLRGPTEPVVVDNRSELDRILDNIKKYPTT